MNKKIITLLLVAVMLTVTGCSRLFNESETVVDAIIDDENLTSDMENEAEPTETVSIQTDLVVTEEESQE